jgi:hypothetical protein
MDGNVSILMAILLRLHVVKGDCRYFQSLRRISTLLDDDPSFLGRALRCGQSGLNIAHLSLWRIGRRFETRRDEDSLAFIWQWFCGGIFLICFVVAFCGAHRASGWLALMKLVEVKRS